MRMKNLLLGITGSVAAIKAPLLVEALSPLFNLKIVLTQSAHYFVQNLPPFLSTSCTLRDEDEWPTLSAPYSTSAPILHIEMRRWADGFLIAPLDANTLAKIHHGLCDNLLTSIVRAWDYQKPFFVAPAMNTMMWENPPTAQQIADLKERGIHCIDPIYKQLACQDVGMGGMAEVLSIYQFLLNHHHLF